MTLAQALAAAMKDARVGHSFETSGEGGGRVYCLKTTESTWLIAYPVEGWCDEVSEDEVLDVVTRGA